MLISGLFLISQNCLLKVIFFSFNYLNFILETPVYIMKYCYIIKHLLLQKKLIKKIFMRNS